MIPNVAAVTVWPTRAGPVTAAPVAGVFSTSTAALILDSALPSSSLKVTRTLISLPESATATV